MILPLLAVVLLALAARATIGIPDLGQAVPFLSGNGSAAGAEVATAALVFWLTVVALLITALVVASHGGRAAGLLRNRSYWAAVVVAVGAMALTAGLMHQRPPPYSVCCGGTDQSLQEARQLVR